MNAIKRIMAEWVLDVRDPEVEDRSEAAEHWKYIISLYLEDGFGWSKSTRYRGNGTYKWCGAFVAWCRPELSLELRRAMASTWRLYNLGNKNPKYRIKTKDVLPGDVVCVGDGDYGSHITNPVAWDAAQSVLVCVGGNQKGRLPDGSFGEGVTMRVYSRDEIKAAYRF